MTTVSTTQTENPLRTSARTFLQTLIPTLLVLLVVVPEVIRVIMEETERYGAVLPASLYAILSAISVGTALTAAIIARITAIPGVELLLRQYAPWIAASTGHPQELTDDGPVDPYPTRDESV